MFMQLPTSFLLSELLHLLITATSKTHPAFGMPEYKIKRHLKEAVGHSNEIFNSSKETMQGLISALHLNQSLQVV